MIDIKRTNRSKIAIFYMNDRLISFFLQNNVHISYMTKLYYKILRIYDQC